MGGLSYALTDSLRDYGNSVVCQSSRQKAAAGAGFHASSVAWCKHPFFIRPFIYFPPTFCMNRNESLQSPQMTMCCCCHGNYKSCQTKCNVVLSIAFINSKYVLLTEMLVSRCLGEFSARVMTSCCLLIVVLCLFAPGLVVIHCFFLQQITFCCRLKLERLNWNE